MRQPSTMKTPTMKAALAPLYAFQEEWYQEWVKQKKQQETKDILIELDKREKKNKPIKHSKIKTRNKPCSSFSIS